LDGLRRQGRTVAKVLLNTDPALAAAVERTDRLLTWMDT
jgi:hypothetical protein